MKCARKYKYLDIIRLFCCVAVLLYHFNVLRGGYLAVCCFFVLSGYLSCVSLFKNGFSFSIYFKKLFRIYLPLIFVVFLSIFVISLIPEINWLNLKPETTSVLLGYNNFWQLGANLDYFARHIDSPFMHLWYISILLQFDLLFPFIFLGLKKIGDKIHRVIPCVLTLILSIVSFVYFYKLGMESNMMIAYYNTFSRLFSLVFGVLLGFVHCYYKPLVNNKIKEKCISKIIFFTYILILYILFIFIEASSMYFVISMLGVTLISCRLIDYSVVVLERNSIVDKVVNSLASVSYEIYLFQYPVIFIFQYIDLNIYYEYYAVVVITLILSYILHFCVVKNNKYKLLKFLVSFVFVYFCAWGIVKYVVAKDYTEEMKQLEQQLADNQKIMEEKQKQYEDNFKQEEEKWLAVFEDLENEEAKLKDLVTNLPVVGVGDSVMLGAINNLYQTFPNGYVDAAVSRTAWTVNDILIRLRNRNMLGEPIVLNMGTNGDCPEWCKEKIMSTIDGRKTFWINTTNYTSINNGLLEFSKKYDNLYIIDWNSISKNHPEYFVADKIHLTVTGRQAYSKVIYDSIYQVYLDEYNLKKEELLKEYDSISKSKISFYGNDILINSYRTLQDVFLNSEFVTKKDYTYETLKEDINKAVLEDTLNYNVVFAFDNSLKLSVDEYKQLIQLCKDHKVYILAINEEISNINIENVEIIDFYEQLIDNADYVMVDRVHLTEKGNEALCDTLDSVLNKD